MNKGGSIKINDWKTMIVFPILILIDLFVPAAGLLLLSAFWRSRQVRAKHYS